MEYRIYNGTKRIASTFSKSYNLTSLSEDTNYTFQVAAYNGLRESNQRSVTFQTSKNHKIIAVNYDSGAIDWATLAKYADLVIIRVQMGAGYYDTDRRHVINIQGASKYSVPFAYYTETSEITGMGCYSEASNCLLSAADATVKSPKFVAMKRNSADTLPPRSAIDPSSMYSYMGGLKMYGCKLNNSLIWVSNDLYSQYKSNFSDFGKTILKSSSKPSNNADLWNYQTASNQFGIPGTFELFQDPSAAFVSAYLN